MYFPLRRQKLKTLDWSRNERVLVQQVELIGLLRFSVSFVWLSLVDHSTLCVLKARVAMASEPLIDLNRWALGVACVRMRACSIVRTVLGASTLILDLSL